MPIFVDWLNVRCIIFTSEKVRIWRKKYPREYRIVFYQFPPLTEYPHLLQLEEILGSSGILRANLGFAVLSLFFVISYRYNIKMGVEAEILAQPKFHYFCIDFFRSWPWWFFQHFRPRHFIFRFARLSDDVFFVAAIRRCKSGSGKVSLTIQSPSRERWWPWQVDHHYVSAKDFQTGLQQMTKTVNHQLGMRILFHSPTRIQLQVYLNFLTWRPGGKNYFNFSAS